MKKFYRLLTGLCVLAGFLSPDRTIAGDTLEYLPGAKTKTYYFRYQRPASYSNTPLNFLKPDPKGLGDDKGVAISFSGSFRFHGMYRVLTESYAGVKPKNLNINGFGDGSQPTAGVPLLTLYSKIVPSDGVDIGIGLSINHIFTGSIDPDSTRGRGPFGQTFGGVANFKTRIGNIRVGGGNLYGGMSQLFSGWPQIRWNPFYRLPWDVSAQYGGSWSSYENSYNNGNVTNIDAAFTSGGRIAGAILHISDMPGGFGANFCYGVDAQTGVLPQDNSSVVLGETKKTFGGRIYNKSPKYVFGITGIYNSGHIDNVSDYRETQYMYSVDANFYLSKFSINGEFGATEFTNPLGIYSGFAPPPNTWDTIQYNSGVDFLGQLRINLKKEALGIPININVYHLGPNYINLNSGTLNTTTYNYSAAYMVINSQWDLAMRKGFIADLGQTTNNRRAVEITTRLDFKRLKFDIGTQVGTEIQAEDSSTNQVMFYHKLNPWSRAGFNYWQASWGPYRRLLSNYIQLLERIPITDSDVNYKKTFNVFNIETRYKTAFLGRAIILSNYNSYQSASDKFSPLPYFTDKAFVRVFYEELTAYYQLTKSTVIVGHAAWNRAVGNNRTQLSPDNGKPIDQQTWGFGAGIDWNFAPMMGLYLREMYMTHRDKNFSLDHFEGYETTLELKVMF